MSTYRQRHLERAAQVAATSTERQAHGCVIAMGPKVLSVGVNVPRNRPHVCTDPHTQAGYHAEISALKGLRSDVHPSRLTLYSARIMANGTTGLAKPCKGCQTVLDYLGLTDIVWTE